MAHYTALEAYALFTPPQGQYKLFPEHIPEHLQQKAVEQSPSISASPAYDSPVAFDSVSPSQTPSPLVGSVSPADESPSSGPAPEADSPAMSQMYAMRRK